MFPTIPINEGISPSEIQALNAWGQKLLKDAWNYKKWPARLYHYTTPEGFHAIVESGTLRGTHVGFTNDFQEYRHAVSLALEQAQRLKATAVSEDVRTLLGAICENLRGTTLFTMHPFGIACFSEHPDKLSQWRAYGKGEGGIAIGFDTSVLVAQANMEGTTFGPVIYDESKKQKIVDECFDWMLVEYPSRALAYPSEKRKDHINAWVYNWAFRAAFIAPMVKDKGFEEEDEWRLVRRFMFPGDVRFLAKSSHLRPYLEMNIGVPRSHPTNWAANDPRRLRPMPPKLPIVELWFGPGRYQEHAHASCKAFLEYYDYGGVALYTSKTPFRSIA